MIRYTWVNCQTEARINTFQEAELTSLEKQLITRRYMSENGTFYIQMNSYGRYKSKKDRNNEKQKINFDCLMVIDKYSI